MACHGQPQTCDLVAARRPEHLTPLVDLGQPGQCASQTAITEAVVTTTADAEKPAVRVHAWVDRDPETVGRAGRLLSDVLDEETGDLPRLSVGLRAVRTLLTERADTSPASAK